MTHFEFFVNISKEYISFSDRAITNDDELNKVIILIHLFSEGHWENSNLIIYSDIKLIKKQIEIGIYNPPGYFNCWGRENS